MYVNSQGFALANGADKSAYEILGTIRSVLDDLAVR